MGAFPECHNDWQALLIFGWQVAEDLPLKSLSVFIANEFRILPQVWPGFRRFQQDVVLLSLASDLLHAGISKLCSGPGQMVQRSSRLASSQPECVCVKVLQSSSLRPHGLYSLWSSPG